MSHSILVTGGAGFIGQNFVHHIIERNEAARIVVLDCLTYAANPSSLGSLIEAGKIVFEHASISDLDAVARIFRTHDINVVAHFAAESHVDRSIAGPDAFIETNIIGTYNLLKCALTAWRERDVLTNARFLHVSTDEVFGDLAPEEAPFTETSPYRPNSPYSASKASSDHLARAFHRTYGLPVLITNCSNNYGPYQHPEKLIPLMIINCLTGQKLPIYGDGMNVRDWLYVGDHCNALSLVLAHGKVGSTYNVGGGAERNNRQVVNAICDIIDALFAKSRALAERYPACPAAAGESCKSLITFVADRPGHDRRYAIDPAFLKSALGYVPDESFETGLTRTVAWYLEHQDWWQHALTGDFQQWISANYGNR